MKHTIVVRILNARSDASQRLGKLLEKVHAKMPNVDEEEAEQLINAEVTRMRAPRRKQKKIRPRPVGSRRRVGS